MPDASLKAKAGLLVSTLFQSFLVPKLIVVPDTVPTIPVPLLELPTCLKAIRNLLLIVSNAMSCDIKKYLH